MSSHACCWTNTGLGRRSTSESQLWSCSLLSWTFAPERTRPRGTPFWSTTLCRFVPNFPRSVGFFPIFFPPHGCRDRLTVQDLPPPFDSFQIVILLQAVNPHLAKDPLRPPPLEISMSRRACIVLTRQHLPLAAGSQNIQYAVQDLSRLGGRPPLPGFSLLRLRDVALDRLPKLIAHIPPPGSTWKRLSVLPSTQYSSPPQRNLSSNIQKV